MDIEELTTLKIEPGSVLVVKAGRLDKDTAQKLREYIVEHVPALKGRILVIDSLITLSALEVV